MTINKNHRSQSGGIFSIFRRGPQWQQIDGYHVEDLNSEQPVWVTAGSTMLGNIIAPQIKVAGMVNGAVVSQAVTIMPQGEIWGDVYTGQLQIEPGGAVYGWISSIDSSQYQQIQEQGSLPDTLSRDTATATAADAEFTPYDPAQIEAFSRLRHEAAAAKTARAELEQTFEKRLSEVAGEATARVVSLREELAAIDTNLTTAQQQLKELKSSLAAHQNQIERQAEELTATRTLLDERNKELKALQQSHDNKNSAYEQLDTAYKELDMNHIAAQQKIDALAKKIDNLEGALQNNLRHSADQEEALIRWQELAEDYQKQIGELETQIEHNKFQVEEQSRVIEMLRGQRDQLETEWQQAQDELDLLRSRETRPLSKDELEHERSLAEAYKTAQVELEQLQTAVSQLSQYEDQVIWYQADLETARAELQETRAVVGKQETRLANLQEKLRTAQTEAKAKQKQTDRLNEQLEQQIRQSHALEQQLNQIQLTVEEKEANKLALEKSQRQFQLQLEAVEMELERHLRETEAQGHHLAEIQTTLIERELKMDQLKKTAVARAQTIVTLKDAARKRVHTLEKQLAQSQEQVNELKLFIERRHKKSSS
ncbi:MAG: polymer-forming cytoskeletal protein [Chloroflexota bacterium]